MRLDDEEKLFYSNDFECEKLFGVFLPVIGACGVEFVLEMCAFG